jgi:hypothetical protein
MTERAAALATKHDCLPQVHPRNGEHKKEPRNFCRGSMRGERRRIGGFALSPLIGLAAALIKRLDVYPPPPIQKTN